jgi:hypothetical protein
MEKKLDISAFIFGLLGKRRRRAHILAHWHTGKCIGGETDARRVVFLFTDWILNKPIHLSMYPDYFRIFPVGGLNIYYTWLLPHEREFLIELYNRRTEYFASTQHFASGGFQLLGCKNAEFSLENRKELVRDFFIMFRTVVKWSDYVLVHACQQLLIQSGGKDMFIRELHEGAQGRVDFKVVGTQ